MEQISTFELTIIMTEAKVKSQEDIEDEEPEDTFGSLSDEDVCDAMQNDTWIEELECALLADCDPATLKRISEGRRIPATLRPDYWRNLLALNDTGKVRLNTEYDLPNQLEIRQDCEKLVEDIATTKSLTDADKLRLISDYESTLTTYIKARPELSYVSDNGWIDILKVLHNLELDVSQLYQIFFRIVDRYIPKSLSYIQMNSETHPNQLGIEDEKGKAPSEKSKFASIPQNFSSNNLFASEKDHAKSIQAYHLLRLLIQYHDPELCSILDSKKLTPNLYAKDWFCSLFARSCSTKVSLLIWDTHFEMADPFLIFFAAIVMVANASDELKKFNMTQNDMLRVLKSMPSRLEEDDIEDLYYLVSNHYTNSTPKSIRSYSHLFFMDTFGNTYSGNESPEDGPQLVDLKTAKLTNSLDLSQYLCLPIVPAEIFALDTAQFKSSPTQGASMLRYFLVDCRPAEQYNAGHLVKAFHLDCSLMLREPSSFATAVQALLEIQRQVVASKSNTGGRHLCFIGSGQEEEDQYVNMVVASFLQKYESYVSIVHGGFEAIHDYLKTKSELKDSFDKYIIDHNEERCKSCCSKNPDLAKPLNSNGKPDYSTVVSNSTTSTSGVGSFSGSAQSLFATTTSFLRGEKSSLSNSSAGNIISQSGASMFDNLTRAFVTKSSVIKEKLVESLNTNAIPASPLSGIASGAKTGRGHVSSQDKLGKRYTGSNVRRSSDDVLDDLSDRAQQLQTREDAMSEPLQEIQIDSWQKDSKIIAFFKCSQIKGSAKYPGYIALSKTHLWILREIPHNKGFASIAAKRPLDMIVQITSKRKQPDFIIFRYGYHNNQQNSFIADTSSSSPDERSKSSPPINKGNGMPQVIASDHLHIPQAFEVIRLVKREVIRIMDETSRELDAKAAEIVDENSPDVQEPVTEPMESNVESQVKIEPDSKSQ